MCSHRGARSAALHDQAAVLHELEMQELGVVEVCRQSCLCEGVGSRSPFWLARGCAVKFKYKDMWHVASCSLHCGTKGSATVHVGFW